MLLLDRYLPLITWIVIPVVMAVIIYVKKRHNRPLLEALDRLGPVVLGTVRMSLFLATHLKGTYGGDEVKVVLTAGGRRQPPTMAIYLFSGCPFDLRLTREGLFTHLFKGVGILKEITVGDADFDRQFLVQTDDPLKAEAYLLNPEVRDHVLALAAVGFEQLDADVERLLVRKPNYRTVEDCAPERFRGVLDRIVALRQLM